MFYRFAHHVGDDNDNSISEVIVDAPTLEDALNILYELLFAIPDMEVLQETDGEYSRVYGMIWEETDDEEGIPLHSDYYFEEEHDTYDAALQAIPYYHGFEAHYTYEGK